MALTNATPASPQWARESRFCLLMPPMATTGTPTAAQMARSVSLGRAVTFVFVVVANIAPQPR